jgi:serine/threonine protein kinase
MKQTNHVGTELYMAPECHKKNYDTKLADVFAFGLTLLEALYVCKHR